MPSKRTPIAETTPAIIRISRITLVWWCLVMSALAAIPENRTLSVLAHGATPDDASDDTSAINTAIATLAAQGGGTVVFPRGVYLVNTTVMSRPVLTKSNIRLKGERDTSTNALLSVLKMPRPVTNQNLLIIGDPSYADPATDKVINPSAVQENIEIVDLAFDLDNGRGRRAIQLRYPTNRVVIRDCEAFQSGIDRGEAPDPVNKGDNHFFNLGCYSSDPATGNVPTDILVEGCKVRGNLQLLADGGNGVRNLIIRNNEVRGALSHGIALTTVGRKGLFDTILIENNQVLEIGGDGLYLSIDGSTTREGLVDEGVPFAMRRVTIRNNHFALGPGSLNTASGVNFGTFPTFSDVIFEGNTITGHPHTTSTSRNALVIDTWDLNWEMKGKNAILNSEAFAPDGTIRITRHPFSSGMQVQLQPLSTADALPEGFEAFRRYRIARVDGDVVKLLDSATGATVKPGRLPKSVSSYKLVFAPASERLTIRNNTIEGTWDYAIVARGSVDLLLADNTVSGNVVVSGDHEGLQVIDNAFDRDFNSGVAPTSLLPLSAPSSGRLTTDCTFTGNLWNLDENAIGNVFIYKAAITFATNDPLRTLKYVFTNNAVTFKVTGKPLYSFGVIDSTSTGAVFAHYADNLLDRSLSTLASPLTIAPPITPDPAPVVSEPPTQTEPPAVTEVPTPSELVFTNLSCRGLVGDGEAVMIVGFTISGTGTQKLLVRASGPALNRLGVPGCLTNPSLKLHSSATSNVVAQNEDWASNATEATAIADAAREAGAFAWGEQSKDAAAVVSLPPGGYTVVVTGAVGDTGVALVELYTLGNPGGTRLVNLSARLQAGAGANQPIIGMTLSGEQQRKVLVRGCGPGLGQFSINNYLADPRMTFYTAGSTPVAIGQNDNWSGDKVRLPDFKAAAVACGAFPFAEGSTDSAMLVSLSAGGYTAVIEGENAAGRVALIEAYLVP